jgi:hypothetical protein
LLGPANILQCFFAQFIRIAFTGLGKRDDFLGDRFFDVTSRSMRRSKNDVHGLAYSITSSARASNLLRPLRARRDRPSSRAAEQRDELPPLHH